VKLDKRFPIQVGVTLTLGLAAAMLVVSGEDREVCRAVIAGAILSTLNVIAGFLAIEYSFEKSHTTFLKAVLGGMGLRMGVMLVLVVILVRFVGLHATALVVSVLSFYIVYLVLEIFYIQKKVSHKAQ
jgi:hypothetical protein